MKCIVILLCNCFKLNTMFRKDATLVQTKENFYSIKDGHRLVRVTLMKTILINYNDIYRLMNQKE